MGWAAGVFSRVHDWEADEAAGENIEAARMDAEDDNFATGINTCLTKDGQNAATADLPMGTNKHTGVGDGTARTHYPSIGQLQDGGVLYAAAGGAANVITLTLSPVLAAYVAGQQVLFKALAVNTGATTININGLGAKNIYYGGAALSGGEITAGEMFVIAYDGTQFNLINAFSPLRLTASAHLTSDQSIANATMAAISWDAELHDYGGFWAAGNPTRFTVPYTGVYRATANIVFDGNATGLRAAFITVNGATPPSGQLGGFTTGAVSTAKIYANAVMPDSVLTAADYIEVYAYQDSGGALDVLNAYSKMSIAKA